MHDLDEAALIEILTKPKNALIKQYQALFGFDNVELNFSDDALEAIAKKAISRKTGARGLRAILEELLLESMFNLPTSEGLKEVAINEKVVAGESAPLLIYSDTKKGKTG